MLELRHLHSHNARKKKELKVCNIIATFDFNGLKFFNTGNKRKGDSCFSMHIPGVEDFSKKIRLNDVASKFHTIGSTRKSVIHEDVKIKACGEEKIFRKSSLSAVYNGETDQHVIVGSNNNGHICMSYAAFKEKYEMSMTNIIRYAQHLELEAQIRDSAKATLSMEITKPTQFNTKTTINESTPFVPKSSAKCFHMKGNKLVTKFREEKGTRMGSPNSNLNKSSPKTNIEKYNATKGNKKTLKKKSYSNGEAKKSKLVRSIGKQENSCDYFSKKNNYVTTSPAKQSDVVGISRGEDEKDACHAVDINFIPNGIESETFVIKECYENVTKLTPRSFKTPVPAVEHLFACSICTDSFVSQNTLDMHLKYDHRPRPTCSQCLKMFDCRRKLIDHEANCSTSDTPVVATATQSLGGIIDFISPVEVFFCVKCENPFPSKNFLRQHKILLNKRKPIALELSEESSSSSYYKNELWEICVKKMPSYSAPPLFDNDYNKCGYCGKSFQNIRRFNQHSVFCYQMKKVLLERECIHCKKSFRNAETCDRHTCYCTKITHGISLINNNDYPCELCDQVLKRLTDYNLHLRLNHDQRYCCKCSEMYTPDAILGLSHECVIPSQRIEENTDMSIKDKKEKSSTQNLTKQVKRKTNKFVREECLLRYNQLAVKNKAKDFTLSWNDRSMGENNLLQAFGDKMNTHKENIPIDVNKIEACNFPNYEGSTPRINEGYKLRASVTNSNKSSFHCIFCPERSFTKRSLLDGHLRIRHNKKQCEFCGDIFRCDARPYHDCLYCIQPKEVNNNAFEKNINDSLKVHVPLAVHDLITVPLINSIKENNIYKRTEEIVEIIDSESSQPIELLDTSPKSPRQIYKCYKCAKIFSQKHFMIKHLVNHSKRNPYKCKYCNKLFKIPRYIDDHIRNVHHPHTYIQRKPIVESLTHRHRIKQCHICMNFFLGVADLKSHQKDFHDLLVNGNSNDVSMCVTSSALMPCHLCHKTNSLTKTVKFANGIDQVCIDCSDALASDCFTSFEKASSPTEVKNISAPSSHDGGIEYQCEYCSKSFNYKGLLDEHDQICFGKKQTFEENELIKPLIPTAESCIFEFNFSNEQCNGDVLTFEEAHATLQSLDVNYGRSDEDVSKIKAEFYKSSSHATSDVENTDTVEKEVPFFTRSSHSNTKNNTYLHSSSNWKKESGKTVNTKNIPGVLKSMDYENITPKQDKMLNVTENVVPCDSSLRILNVFQIYPCRECSVNFDSQCSLDYHIKDSHKKDIEENKSEIPLKSDDKQSIDKLLEVESYRKKSDNSVCHVENDKTGDLVPSPNRSPVFKTIEDRVVHCVPVPSERSIVKEYKCPLNCRSDSSRHSQPCGNCSIIDSIIKCPLHKNYHDSSTDSKLVVDLVSKKSSRKLESGIFNDKETCKCCNLKFFNTPQFIKPHMPKQKKHLSSCFNMFYPGEYPTSLLKKYLPLPPSYISYAPIVKDSIGNTYQPLDLFNSPYQSNTIHHRPPYAYEGLSFHPGNKVIESRFLDPFSVPNMPKRQKHRTKVEVVGETPITSPVSPTSPTPPTSPTCDVNVVVDLLKPLSPKSLEKSLQNGSRPKYSKSEVVLKMSRLADTLGRKFGARFKRNAFDFMKDLP